MGTGTNNKLVSFSNLEVWQEGHKLVVKIYKLTDKFPKYDSLGSQMQRSAVSVTSNIAEGFGRQLQKDKTHFYIMARGSLVELQNQILIARDVGKVSKTDFNVAADQTITVLKLLHGLIRSMKKS